MLELHSMILRSNTFHYALKNLATCLFYVEIYNGAQVFST